MCSYIGCIICTRLGELVLGRNPAPLRVTAGSRHRLDRTPHQEHLARARVAAGVLPPGNHLISRHGLSADGEGTDAGTVGALELHEERQGILPVRAAKQVVDHRSVQLYATSAVADPILACLLVLPDLARCLLHFGGGIAAAKDSAR